MANQAHLPIPWSPIGVMKVSTDKHGFVTGELALDGVQYKGVVTGKVSIAPVSKEPLKHTISATVKLTISVTVPRNNAVSVIILNGEVIEGTDYIVGTIAVEGNEFYKMPDGKIVPKESTGHFILYPLNR